MTYGGQQSTSKSKNHPENDQRIILVLQGIAKGGVKNRNKGGCRRTWRLFAFARVCLRLLTFSRLRLSAFVCVCLRLLAFAYAPLCYAPLCVTLIVLQVVFDVGLSNPKILNNIITFQGLKIA